MVSSSCTFEDSISASRLNRASKSLFRSVPLVRSPLLSSGKWKVLPEDDESSVPSEAGGDSLKAHLGGSDSKDVRHMTSKACASGGGVRVATAFFGGSSLTLDVRRDPMSTDFVLVIAVCKNEMAESAESRMARRRCTTSIHCCCLSARTFPIIS